MTTGPEDVHRSRPPRRRRWGLWTLAFLGVALAAVLTSSDGWTAVSALAVLVSFGAAGYCSYRGIKEFTWLPR